VKPFRVILSGGGTGGHIFPALAIADALKRESASTKILFVGASDRMEMTRVPDAGYPIKGLWISGIKRNLSFQNLLFPFKLVASLYRSYLILKKFKPQVVIGTGGFASGPLLYMATRLNIPSLIQEQNALPGITNRVLGKYVHRVCVAHQQAEKFFSKNKMVLTGNPLRAELTQSLLDSKKARKLLGLEPNKVTLLVVGGSLGARRINDLLAEQAERITSQNVQILWQCGKLYEKEFSRYEKKNIHVRAFLDDMSTAYAAADLIISRAGALAVSELCQVGKAVLFIPSPNVAENHQFKNAIAVAEKGAAIVIEEKELDKNFEKEIDELLTNITLRSTLGGNIKKLAKSNATASIVEQVKALVND
jgi:UDP-N-acetylglucosamine--N-acetylmuramyl-(pentapeptide) pyrophosphoryl-undecaprenol N-acetylglucosamine transferase